MMNNLSSEQLTQVSAGNCLGCGFNSNFELIDIDKWLPKPPPYIDPNTPITPVGSEPVVQP